MNTRDQLRAIVLATILIVSMVAVGATTVGTVGAQSPTDTIESTGISSSDTTSVSTDHVTSAQQAVSVSDSQPAQVAKQLEDASGETTVILLVDRSIGQSVIESGEATAEDLRQDSELTLEPVKDQISQLSNAEVNHEYWIGNALSVEIDLDQYDISTLAELPGVTSVIPNVQFETPTPPTLNTDVTSDEVSTEGITPDLEPGNFTYGLQKIGIPSFEQQFETDGEGATVAIIDDGISNPDEGHPDLDFAQTAVATDGVITEGTLGSPGAHGEHVSGTATGAADPAGDVPRYGVAPNASLIEINAFEEGAFLEDILAGVQYAVEEDADVAGMSLGFPPTSDLNPMINAVDRQMEEANAAGTLVSVSAGNSGDGDEGGPVTSPAPEFGAFSVGATFDNPVNVPEIPASLIPPNTGSNNDVVTFSSGGVISDRTAVPSFDYPETYPRQYVQPDVSAPGTIVISAGPLGTTPPSLEDDAATYSFSSGTSMAQPHVAGAVALIQSATTEDLGPKQIEAALVETAEKPANNFTELNSRDIRYGAGIINVTAATLAAQSENLEIDGTVTDTNDTPLVGATVESEDGALTATNETGQYTLQTTSPETNITADAFGYASETKEVNSSDTVDFSLEEQLELDLVQGQPAATEIGGQFDIEADVGSLDNLTVSLNDSTTFRVTDNEVTVTLTTEDGTEVPLPLGDTVDLGGYTGPATITVEVYQNADVSAGDELVLDHVFEGAGDRVEVTTGPTTLVDAAGVADSVSIDADFVGAVNDQPTTTVTAEGLVTDGQLSDGDRVTFTIGGEPVATGTTVDGSATAEVNAETLDLDPQEDVDVDILEFEAVQTDTVNIVDEVIDLDEGFNLVSVPQPATLTTQDINSLNRWDSGTQTYETVTSPEFDSAADLHNGLYVDADSDNARLGLTFDQGVPTGNVEDIDTQWNLLGSNFPTDSSSIGERTTIENDLTGVNADVLELFSPDFSEFLTPSDTVGTFDAYWAFNPTNTADERGITSSSYTEEDRRDVLGQGDSNFQPTIVDSELTSIEDAESQTLLEDTSVVGASEQVLLVDVLVENIGDGSDAQFVDLSVQAPVTFGLANLELVDQTGVELGPGEFERVTLSFVASADETQSDNPNAIEDIFFEVETEDGSDDFGFERPSAGGIAVSDQALSTDGEFVVDNVDIADHGTVELVDANDTVLDSVEFEQGINRQVVFDDFAPANVTDSLTVRVLEEDQSDATDQVLVSETVDVLDTRFEVFNQAPEFALVNETVDVPVTVVSNVAVPEDNVEVNFSVGGTNIGTQTVNISAFGFASAVFPVDTTGLSVGETVDHTATSPDDNETRTLTIAEATLAFNDQSLNADGEVLVEDVTADEGQTIVVTDTDLNVVGEVDVANITTGGERGIDDENVLVNVTGTTAGTHIAHVVADEFTVPDEGPGLVNQEANITASSVALAGIDNQTVSEAELPVEVVSSVTVDSEVVDAVGDRNSNYTVEIRQGGTVVGASDNLSDDRAGVTIELDDPVVVDEAQPEQTFTLTAVLVDQNGNEFDVPTGTNLNDDGFPFPVLTGNLDSAADEESFTVNVSGAENVNLPDQALGAANGSDAVLVNNVAADAGQFVVITPADDNNNVLGVTQFNETVSGGERIVEFDQEVSAGEFRAHITTDTGLLGDDGALVTDTGSVFNASVTITDQTFVGGTDELTVDSSNLQAEDPANYQIVVHDQTRANSSAVGPTPDDVGPPLGVSDVLTGSESGVPIDLGQSITSTQDVLVMLHFTNPGAPGPGGAIPVLNGSAFGFSDGQNGTITDTATVSSTESAQTFNDQALTTGDILIEDVQVNQTSAVVVTYPNGGNLTIAGLETNVTGTDAEDIPVTINDAGGFPGEHTVHIIPESGLSQTYSVGDNVSSETAANITSQESATVFDASVTIDDQAFEDETSTFNVTTSDLQPATASDYVVVIHDQTNQSAGEVGPAIGATGVLNGSQENATVTLFGEPLNETTDVLAMIHFPDAAGTGPGMPIPTLNGLAFGFSDGSAGTVTDTATIEIEQAVNGNVTFSDQALSSDSNVTVENIQQVAVETVNASSDGADSFDPADDFLVLTDGTGVDDGDFRVIDAVQLSNVTGTSTSLNATGASPGAHTVVLHEPNEAGTGPDPDAPRTNASSGEVVNATATVFGGSVTVENQTLEQGTDALDEITVQTAELLDGSADGATFTLNVTSGGTSLGTTTATGANTDVTVPLDEPLDRGTTDVTVTVEVNGAAVQQASGTSFVALQDEATIDVVAAEYTVDTVSLNQSTITEGQNINASVAVTNVGEIDGEKDITLRVLDDGNTTGVSQTRENVQVFSSETRTLPFNGFDVSGLDGGDYTVEVEVPADNNSNSTGLTIQVPAEFTVSINESASDVDVVGGQNVTVNATVENIGDLSGTQNVTLSINRTNLDTEEVPLSGGANTTVELTAPVTKEDDGTDAVVTTADFDTGVDDTDNVTLGVEAPVTNVVSDTEFSTLRSALQNANNGDSLEVAGKTFTPTDDLFVTNDNLTVTGAGTAETTIEANITVTGNDNLLEQFTIEGNYTDDGTGNNFTGAEVTSASPGGFIIIEGNDASVNNTQAENVTVTGSATITNSNVSNNAGTGTITVTNSGTATVSDSSADAVTNNGTATLSNSSADTVSGGGTTAIESPDPADGNIFVDNTTATKTTAETFSGLQAAVNSAAEGATLTVGSGTFNESVTVDVEGLTLESADGADATTIVGAGEIGGPDATIQVDDGSGPVRNVTIEGFTVENPNGKFGIFAGTGTTNANNDGIGGLVIRDNVVQDVSTQSTGGALTGGPAGIGIRADYGTDGNPGIEISNNEIDNVQGNAGAEPVGITLKSFTGNAGFGFNSTGAAVTDAASPPATDTDIRNNEISDITSVDGGFATKGISVSGEFEDVDIIGNSLNGINGTTDGDARAITLSENGGSYSGNQYDIDGDGNGERIGPQDFDIRNNEISDVTGDARSINLGGYEVFGDHTVSQNTINDGAVTRFAGNQSGYQPGDGDALNLVDNTFTSQTSQLYVSDGSQSANLTTVLSENTFNAAVEVVGAQIRAEGTAPADAVVNLDTGATFTGTTAIQDAVDNATSDNTLRVGPGTFNENVNIPTDGITVEGAGADSSTISGKVSIGQGTNSVSTTGVTVRGFTLAPDSGFAIETTIEQDSDVTVEDNRIEGAAGAAAAAFFQNPDGIEIRNNEFVGPSPETPDFTNTVGDLLVVGSGADDDGDNYVIADNTFEGIVNRDQQPSGGNAIEVRTDGAVTIENNDFTAVSSENGNLIFLANKSTNVTQTGNTGL